MRPALALLFLTAAFDATAQSVLEHFRTQSRAFDFGPCNTLLIRHDVNADDRPEVFLSHAEYRVGGVHIWQLYTPHADGVSRYLGNVEVHPRGVRVIAGEPGFFTYEGETFGQWVIGKKGLRRTGDKKLDAAQAVAVPFWAERCPDQGAAYWGGADNKRLQDVDLSDEVISGAHFLAEAARTGDTEELIRLLDTWVDAYAADHAAGAALVAAASTNKLNTLQLLLDLDVRHPVSAIRQATRAAAWEGHADVLAEIFTRDLESNRSSLLQDTLGAASQRGQRRAVDLLLRLGADAAQPTPQWEPRTPLELAAENGHTAIINLFSQSGVDVSRAREIALFRAIDQGDVPLTRQIVESGVSTESLRPGNFPSPALIWSIQSRQPDVALALIELGADVNVVDGRKDTVLIKAAQYGDMDVINAALARGADTRSTNRLGSGAVAAAAAYGYIDIVERLTRLGERRLPEDELSRALVAAARADHPVIVCHLLNRGADPSWQNELGRDAERTAEIASLDDIAALLRNWPAMCPKIGATPS